MDGKGSSTDRAPMYPFQDTSLPTAERVEDLLARLSLDEKLGQMSYQAPAIPRLGIPAYNWWNEALHGVARSGTATVFPQAIALAATFDVALVQQVAETVAREGRAKFNAVLERHGETAQYQGLTYWTPNVNIFRDPRWGRGQETYGEDPFLTAQLGIAYVRGLQSPSAPPDSGAPDRATDRIRSAACAKHFAVHSGPEESRHVFDARVSLKDLYETYLPAFEELVDAGVEAVMGAYNRVNGEPACGSNTLLTGILRGQWGFGGHVVSDCWAIRDFHEHHGVTDGPVASAALAINSGCDLNCGDTYRYAREAVKTGRVSDERIDDAVRRLFTTRCRLGLLDPIDERHDRDLHPNRIDWNSHHDLARRAAARSIVLLKNERDTLPLAPHLRKIYVTGPHAADVDVLMGNYYGIGTRYTTFLEGIATRAGHETKVEYRPGCLSDRPNVNDAQWAAFEAEDADATIVILGNHPFLEGEEGDAIASATKGDRSVVELPDSQRAYLEEIRRRASRVILVLTGGAAFALDGVDDLADAVLLAWYPGQAGGDALASVLFGDEEPAGKLPVSLPRYTDDLPAFDDYRMVGRTYRFSDQAQYPFGFGLGYGSLTIEGATLACRGTAVEDRTIQLGEPGVVPCVLPSILFEDRGGAARRGDSPLFGGRHEASLIVSAVVQNPSARAKRDVMQVYVAHPTVPEAPRYQLCGIEPIVLAAGERRTVSVRVPTRWLTVVDADGVRYLPEAEIELVVGTSSPGGEMCGAPTPVRGRVRLSRES